MIEAPDPAAPRGAGDGARLMYRTAGRRKIVPTRSTSSAAVPAPGDPPGPARRRRSRLQRGRRRRPAPRRSASHIGVEDGTVRARGKHSSVPRPSRCPYPACRWRARRPGAASVPVMATSSARSCRSPSALAANTAAETNRLHQTHEADQLQPGRPPAERPHTFHPGWRRRSRGCRAPCQVGVRDGIVRPAAIAMATAPAWLSSVTA